MTPLQLAESLLEQTYKYGTTDIALDDHLGDFLIDWGRLHIPDDVLTNDGREDHPHITVKYGLRTNDLPPELQKIAQETQPFPIFMGAISLFTTSPEYDVVKVDVESPHLHALNRAISYALPHEDTHPHYRPHATVAYVQKGACDHLVGQDPFEADGVPREFKAYGMRYRAAGDGEDPNRPESMLLFSRTAKPKPDQAMAVAESHSRDNTLSQHGAGTMIESWHRMGLSRQQMTERLRRGHWSQGMAYWHNRREFPVAYNAFVREALAAIKTVDEETASETVANLDPFRGIGFPVDPAQTKFFLRSGSKRREDRQIL